MANFSNFTFYQFACLSWIGSQSVSRCSGGGWDVQLGIIANGKLTMLSALLVVKLRNLLTNSLPGHSKLASR